MLRSMSQRSWVSGDEGVSLCFVAMMRSETVVASWEVVRKDEAVCALCSSLSEARGS